MRSALESLEGVTKATVSLESKEAVVIYDPAKVTIDNMKDIVPEKAGLRYSVKGHSEPKLWQPTEDEMTGKKSAHYSELSIQQLKDQLKEKDFLLINVHIPYAGELPKTDLFIPFNKINENLDKLPKDKNTKIVLYCRSGHMSAVAAKKLVADGYKNVFNIPGGMIAWRNAGNELIHNPQN